ncbi:stage II sporulation protein M [Pseudomonas sp. CHM02]|uniref:stage II sporulation protein M n=1 Tax=Pseudomonas sp. CHM02 TaxID=1463662 RepID=UPI000472BED4|nr:stage II sporulation protein M [Pseudomonas sp. CHM02]
MTFLHSAFALIQQHRRAFIVLNLAFYGLFAVMMLVTALTPELHGVFEPNIDKAFAEPGLFKMAGDIYASKNLPLAMAITFLVNLGVAVGMTTLPSLLIPFAGIALTLYRGFLWGVMFSPIGADRATLIPHSLTLLIEGQAYVLAAFAVYVQGRMWLWPHRYGLGSRWDGYKAGVRATGRLYLLVTLALLIGAVYEALEVIYLMPLLV